MAEQLTLFPEAKKPKKPKKVKPPAMLQGKVYYQFPKPPDHKDVPSVDPEADYWWTFDDWQLFLNKEHPNINYEQS